MDSTPQQFDEIAEGYRLFSGEIIPDYSKERKMDTIPQLVGRPPVPAPNPVTSIERADIVKMRVAMSTMAAWIGQTPAAIDSKLTAAALEALRAAGIP